jgi:hypothetical protein
MKVINLVAAAHPTGTGHREAPLKISIECQRTNSNVRHHSVFLFPG